MDCIFCKIAAGEVKADILHKDEEVVAFRDIAPQAPVHVLVIPRRHIPSLEALEEADTELVGKITMVARRLARDLGLDGRGYRLVWNCGPDAGQAVFHIHCHLLGGRKMSWPPG